MAETWVIADPHFGHEMVAGLRGFSSSVAHDRNLVTTCARKFKDGDTIWWLGDIAFNGWKDRLPITVGALPGIHHLILGNHDRAHPLNSRGHMYSAEFLTVFATVQLAARVSWNGVGAMLSHFPYSGDHTKEARYNEWRLPDCGKTLIHGHTHSKEFVSYSTQGTIQLHAGVVTWEGPVTLADLLRTVS